MRGTSPITILLVAALGTSFPVSGAQTTPVPVPQPFPGAASPPPGPAPAARAPQPATPPGATPAPTTTATPPSSTPSGGASQPAPAGVPVYPTAEYLGTYDAGAGQQYVLYGSQLPYVEIVSYYRTALKNGGREIFRTPMPPTHQFDLGRYNEDRMAFPPSVVVRDYTWNNSPGYLHVVGTSEKRYRTVIQIVAPGPTP